MSPASATHSTLTYGALKGCGMVEAVGPAGFVTDPGLLENRFSFARALRKAPPA